MAHAQTVDTVILEILQSDWAALLSAAEQILHKLDGRPGHAQLDLALDLYFVQKWEMIYCDRC